MADRIPEKTKLERLSSELPEAERKQLLAKIARNQRSAGRGGDLRVELKHEEREQLISQEMFQLDWWTRFILWLKRLLSGKSKRDLFLQWKLGRLKRRISQRTPGLTGFETRDLTPRFARHLFDLYTAAHPLQDLFQRFSQDQAFRDQAILELVNQKYPQARSGVEEIVTLEQMEAIYAQKGSEEAIKTAVLRKFNEYLRGIPQKLFLELEEGFNPLVCLQNLVLFSFSAVFWYFNYDPRNRLDPKYPYFNHGPVMLLLDDLERLYQALYLSSKLSAQWSLHYELLNFYCRKGGEPEEEGKDPQSSEDEVLAFIAALSELVEARTRFIQRVPLLDLLKYFHKDPYYRLEFDIPRLRLKNIYASGMRERFLGQLEEKIPVVIKRVLDRRILQLFGTGLPGELFFYNDNPSFDFRKLGLPHFTHTRSLVLLYSYLSKIYKGQIQEILQLASSYVLSNNRLVQGKLTQCAAGLEDLEARIAAFDRSLSPDEEDGKSLMRYRHHIATDLTQQKLYRSFILQKDQGAEELLDRGQEYISGIKKIFDELLASSMANVRSALQILHVHRGKNFTLSTLLGRVSESLGVFLSLSAQLRKLEKGS